MTTPPFRPITGPVLTITPETRDAILRRFVAALETWMPGVYTEGVYAALRDRGAVTWSEGTPPAHRDRYPLDEEPVLLAEIVTDAEGTWLVLRSDDIRFGVEAGTL